MLTIVDNRKERLQKSLKLLNAYAMSLGESVSAGPFFKAYVANLLPGQFMQPFVDAAFSDLGLDPNVLLPSQRTDPQIGQPGTPPLPVPYPRTGQGGRAETDICPTRSPATPAIRAAVRPDAAARPHRLLPLPRAAAGAAAGRPAAGTARGRATGAGVHPRADAEPRSIVPAPGEVRRASPPTRERPAVRPLRRQDRAWPWCWC